MFKRAFFIFFCLLLPALTADAARAARFLDNGDGTVTDTQTGLMWTKDANLPKGGMLWQEALDYVNNMNQGRGTFGHADWRVPEIEELMTLVEPERPGLPKIDPQVLLGAGPSAEAASKKLRDSNPKPAIPGGHPFKAVVPYWYWSSTTTEN